MSDSSINNYSYLYQAYCQRSSVSLNSPALTIICIGPYVMPNGLQINIRDIFPMMENGGKRRELLAQFIDLSDVVAKK